MCLHGRRARTHTPPLKTRTATLAMGLRSPSCLLLLLVLLMPAALAAAACTNTDPCTKQPDCDGCDPNDLVPDPENCRGYYLCLTSGPSSLPFDCPAGQVFDATSHTCVVGDECDECTVEPPTGSCSFECPETGSRLISSFTDCHSYYECDGGKVTGSGTCDASKFFFNGEECQTDERLCCHCHPYCTEADAAGTFVADPLDCRSYYFCTDASAVPTRHGTCPDGEHFDYLLQGCSPAAACATRLSCLNVVGADGCIDPFTCVSVGYFARCPNQCTADYYHCTAATGTYQDVESCAVGTVFHPDNHNCVPLANCPY
ncbi:peritrophin-48-like isoform X8 [Eriocheir sinensis]|uniref:peritrophin-48-like isoform X8 n=1 Tax=Eriocheir sinensis TaxID=95602 RepID=UPI0021C68A18|nr:peritrophin-48-like isoform X8 [Eriocheir sinensis]